MCYGLCKYENYFGECNYKGRQRPEDSYCVKREQQDIIDAEWEEIEDENKLT